MNLLYVHEHIQDIEADCIMATFNPYKHSCSQANWAIRQCAGNYYDEQLNEALVGCPIVLGNENVYIARYDEKDHSKSLIGPKDVVYVRDYLNLPLRDIVANGLLHANDSGHESIILPTPRIEIASNTIEKETTVKQMMSGIRKFRRQRPHSRRCLNKLMLVEIGGDTELIRLLQNAVYNFNRR